MTADRNVTATYAPEGRMDHRLPVETERTA
jgi:hypothetical protein